MATSYKVGEAPWEKSLPSFPVGQAPWEMPDTPEQPQTVFKQLELATNIKSAFNTRVGRATEAQQKSISGEQSLASGALQTLGQGAGFIGDVVGETFLSAGKALLPKAAENKIAETAQKVFSSQPIEKAVELYSEFSAKHPEAAKNLESLVNLGSLLPIGAGAKVGSKAISTGAKEVVDIASDIKTLARPVKDIKTLSPAVRETIQGRAAAFEEVSNRYVSVDNAVNRAKTKGFNPLEDIARDDRFVPKVDKEGTIDASLARKAMSDYIKPVAEVERKAILAEGRRVSFDKYANEMRKEIADLAERGSSYETIANKIESDIRVYRQFVDENGTIALEKIDDIKNAKYQIANWMNEDAQIADKSVARASRKMIIENTSNADVKALNDVMSRYYSARDVLDAMDGKKVQGGRLGKYASRIVGTIAGSHFGPIGAIAGGQIGDVVAGQVMKNKFNIGGKLRIDTPDILNKTEQSLSTPPMQLPSTNPVSSASTLQGQSLPLPKGSKASTKSTAFEPKSKTVKGIIKASNKIKETPNKQGGFARNPFAVVDIPKSIRPESVAGKMDNTDFYLIEKYVREGESAKTAEVKTILKEMGISKADVDIQDRFLKDVLDEYRRKETKGKPTPIRGEAGKFNGSEASIPKDIATEARKYKSAEEFANKASNKVVDELRNQGVRGAEQRMAFWEKATKGMDKTPVIDSLNPTGGLLVDYTPQARMTAKLADNITTLDKTMGKSPDEMITIYRGAPKNQKSIVGGDFVTTNYDLAKSYTGDNNVLSKKVKLSDVLDDINEPLGEEYLYRPKSQLTDIWKKANGKK